MSLKPQFSKVFEIIILVSASCVVLRTLGTLWSMHKSLYVNIRYKYKLSLKCINVSNFIDTLLIQTNCLRIKGNALGIKFYIFNISNVLKESI